ncbi:MAG TPA: hypothetical protein P5133_15785, partial [Spirochaetia bacterium]|nr:hypothetical protein [Spirochaetia bacterium]
RETAKAALAERGYDPAYGARPMRRLLQSAVEDALSEEILGGRLGPGSTAVVELKGGELRVRAKRAPQSQPKPPVASR